MQLSGNTIPVAHNSNSDIHIVAVLKKCYFM